MGGMGAWPIRPREGNLLPPCLRCTERAASGDSQRRRNSSQIYRCEDVEIDPSLGCLKRGGLEQHLRQQSFHLLVYMIERRQRLISKEELIENFWQGAAVTDNAVVQCIKEIRKALGDDPHEPRFIRTIHKIGYRFIAEVVEEPLAAEAAVQIRRSRGRTAFAGKPAEAKPSRSELERRPRAAAIRASARV